MRDARTGLDVWRCSHGPLVMLKGKAGAPKIVTDVTMTRRMDKMRLGKAASKPSVNALFEQVEIANVLAPLLGLTMSADLGSEIERMMRMAMTQSATLRAAVTVRAKALANEIREKARGEKDAPDEPLPEMDDERVERHEALADDWIAAIDAEGEW